MKRVLARLTTLSMGFSASGSLIGFFGIALFPTPLLAQQPQAKAFGFQSAATPVMEQITVFHNGILMPIVTAVSLFVLALLLWVMFRYSARRNPQPSQTAHNTFIEVVWTVAPILILVFIAIPSFKLLYTEHEIPPADMTVKVTGYSWYWNYTYPDHGNFAFDSRMLEDKDRTDPVQQPRLLAVDNELVVPVNKIVRVQVTADPQGVIHAFAVPSFGLKIDAIPGRLNELWFKAQRVGVYYGQCSELCGTNHAFMPIAVRVVDDSAFQAWVADAKKKFAGLDAPATTASLR